MNAIDVLLGRRSVPALQLQSPGPSRQQIETAIDAALRAPDHNGLRPWRFVLIEGAQRSAWAELLVERMQQRQPPSLPGKIEKARAFALTAPLVIAVGARILPNHKVPEVEQLLTTGAGVMNLMNVFHAQGYGAVWYTGPNAYDRTLTDALGFAADEQSLGFVYVGTPPATGAPVTRPSRDAFVRDWRR